MASWEGLSSMQSTQKNLHPVSLDASLSFLDPPVLVASPVHDAFDVPGLECPLKSTHPSQSALLTLVALGPISGGKLSPFLL